MLRFRIAAFIDVNKKEFSQYFAENEFEEHIAELTRPTTWGGDHEIRAFSALLNVNINVYGNDSPIFYPTNSSSPIETISLVYTSASNELMGTKNHYHYLINPSYIPGINRSSRVTFFSNNTSNIKKDNATNKRRIIKDKHKENHEKFSYENLNEELIKKNPENNNIIIEKTEKYQFTAQRGMKHASYIQGEKFIYFMCHQENLADLPPSQDGRGVIYQKHQLKIHVSLPEDNPKLRAAGWNCVKEILIENKISMSKVVHENVKMSESCIDGQELGAQQGKEITIYAYDNENLGFSDWMDIINEITEAYQKLDMPKDTIPATTGPRYCRTIKNNPYCTYRYEKDTGTNTEKDKEKYPDPFGEDLKKNDKPVYWDTEREIRRKTNLKTIIQNQHLMVDNEPELSSNTKKQEVMQESIEHEDEDTKNEKKSSDCCCGLS